MPMFGAFSATSALEMLDDSIDLVLTDVMLPGALKGPQLIEVVRQTYPEMPVIYMSGYQPDMISSDELHRPRVRYLHGYRS